MPGLDLDAHDLAEAPAPQLVLDRLEQVVGLVGDREVGVAGDAEDRGVDDLHAREELVEVLGDQLLERHEGVPVGQRHEARQHLGRDLHAGEHLRVADRVVDDDAERQREVGDVGERAPEADRERRQDREDLAPEALVEALSLVGGDVVEAHDADAVLVQRRAQVLLQRARLALHVVGDLGADRVERLARRAAVLERRLDAGVDLVVQARDPDHEELVEVVGGDRDELQPLEQRHGLVLRELDHALVELQPRQLAVEVQLGVFEVELGDLWLFDGAHKRSILPPAEFEDDTLA